MNQETLFDEITEYQGEDGYVCIKCHIRQPIEHFQVMPAGEVKRTCRSCQNSATKLRKELEKLNPYPEDPNYACPICERTIEEVNKYDQRMMKRFLLDHCHETDTFRGWVCHHCNVGLGAFSDNIERVESAVKYLQGHKIANP